MNNVRIVADSGCDLPTDLVAQYNITIVPVLVRFGQEVYPDDQLTQDAFWAHCAQSEHPPATSSPAPISFQREFERLLEAGHDVVCLTLTSGHSGTFNAAWLAARGFGGRVRVVDTRSFSLGMGLQVLRAAQGALAGRSADVIQRTAENMRERTSVIFVLDTLEWVRRGGRLDRLMPFVDRLARTFRIKPVLEMRDGEFRLVAVTRSTRVALQRLESEVRSRLPVEAVGAAYTRGRDMASEVAMRLADVVSLSLADILTVEAGPAFAAHAGPNAIDAVVVRP